MPSKPTHVHFVNDGVLHRMVQRLVSLPIIRVILYNDASHRRGTIVPRQACTSPVPHLVRHRTSPWIEKDLLFIKSKACGPGISRTIHAPPIEGTGRESHYINMPCIKGFVYLGVELNHWKGVGLSDLA